MRVVVRHDLPTRLVINEYAGRLARLAALQRLAVDPDLVGRQDALADVRRLAVDGHAAGDELLRVLAEEEERQRRVDAFPLAHPSPDQIDQRGHADVVFALGELRLVFANLD